MSKSVETAKTLLRKVQVHCSVCGHHWLTEAAKPRCSKCGAGHRFVKKGTQAELAWWG